MRETWRVFCRVPELPWKLQHALRDQYVTMLRDVERLNPRSLAHFRKVCKRHVTLLVLGMAEIQYKIFRVLSARFDPIFLAFDAQRPRSYTVQQDSWGSGEVEDFVRFVLAPHPQTTLGPFRRIERTRATVLEHLARELEDSVKQYAGPDMAVGSVLDYLGEFDERWNEYSSSVVAAFGAAAASVTEQLGDTVVARMRAQLPLDDFPGVEPDAALSADEDYLEQARPVVARAPLTLLQGRQRHHQARVLVSSLQRIIRIPAWEARIYGGRDLWHYGVPPPRRASEPNIASEGDDETEPNLTVDAFEAFYSFFKDFLEAALDGGMHESGDVEEEDDGGVRSPDASRSLVEDILSRPAIASPAEEDVKTLMDAAHELFEKRDRLVRVALVRFLLDERRGFVAVCGSSPLSRETMWPVHPEAQGKCLLAAWDVFYGVLSADEESRRRDDEETSRSRARDKVLYAFRSDLAFREGLEALAKKFNVSIDEPPSRRAKQYQHRKAHEMAAEMNSIVQASEEIVKRIIDAELSEAFESVCRNNLRRTFQQAFLQDDRIAVHETRFTQEERRFIIPLVATHFQDAFTEALRHLSRARMDTDVSNILVHARRQMLEKLACTMNRVPDDEWKVLSKDHLAPLPFVKDASFTNASDRYGPRGTQLYTVLNALLRLPREDNLSLFDKLVIRIHEHVNARNARSTGLLSSTLTTLNTMTAMAYGHMFGFSGDNLLERCLTSVLSALASVADLNGDAQYESGEAFVSDIQTRLDEEEGDAASEDDDDGGDDNVEDGEDGGDVREEEEDSDATAAEDDIEERFYEFLLNDYTWREDRPKFRHAWDDFERLQPGQGAAPTGEFRRKLKRIFLDLQDLFWNDPLLFDERRQEVNKVAESDGEWRPDEHHVRKRSREAAPRDGGMVVRLVRNDDGRWVTPGTSQRRPPAARTDTPPRRVFRLSEAPAD